MADEILLNNYSDDSQIKKFMRDELAPRVFHDIPLNVLNTGFFSLVSEYISQITEQLGFTSSFYFNEAFITKAVLPDSIYAEAAIFNLGYSFATPASTNFLLELKIEDIYNNSVFNADNGLYEFVLDKNTKFNLPEGFVYSLDYDILIQYKDIATSSMDASIPAWNIQYINRNEANMCATNKNVYITYRVTDVWLCLLIQANEYEREVHTVVNNTTTGIPNEDTVIMCQNHIAGFDIKYIDSKGNQQYLQRDHILTIHDTIEDNAPYVNYIMDNPQTIRFMWQLSGSRFFVPEMNSSFEITIYTCHGKSANAPNYKNDQQPQVITAANTYSNNANVMKAAFVISGCVGGADIGTVETTRRETIEAYNTANVLSTDHDLDEWFKTFYFKNILYPFFFKRRDDPWGRIWSGYMALSDNDVYVYRTNTLHAHIPYEVLYNNNDNTVSSNEIIIPPGWIWVYIDDTTNHKHLYTVTPYTKADGKTIETVNTLASITDKFVFANPFGMRIQKDPFAIGYFNPWVNEYVTATKITRATSAAVVDNNKEDISYIYHASPIITNIKRTYKDDHYTITSYILPNIPGMNNGKKLVEYVRANAVAPYFDPQTWNYMKQPLDVYAESIPLMILTEEDGYIPFDPENTYLCVEQKDRIDDNTWRFGRVWIEEKISADEKRHIDIRPSADKMYLYGTNDIWGTNGACAPYSVAVSGVTDIDIFPVLTSEDLITFSRIPTQNYYEMRLAETAPRGTITKIVVGEATKTELTKYGESQLVKIGKSYSAAIYINVYYAVKDDETNTITEKQVTYTISNAANVYMPYMWSTEQSEPGKYVFEMDQLGSTSIILYADMKPSPESGAIAYYRMPFNLLPENEPMLYVHSEQLPLALNNLRVIMHAIVNGSETGRVEMQPVSLESDGSYKFETTLYPLTELLDIDNRINMASMNNGGGSWEAVNGDVVSVDASDPQFKITILVRSDDANRDSEIEKGDSYTGFRVTDEYMLDDVDLIQELKEMRSVVEFGEDSVPSEEQINLYKRMLAYSEYNASDPYNMYYLTLYAYNMIMGVEMPDSPFSEFRQACSDDRPVFRKFFTEYGMIMSEYGIPDWFAELDDVLTTIINHEELPPNIVPITDPLAPTWVPNKFYMKNDMGKYILLTEEPANWVNNYLNYYVDTNEVLDWYLIYDTFSEYQNNVNKAFEPVNINGGMTVQLVPFVEYSLMLSDRFENFVSSFTQIHKAIEPVIFKRLEGNNYLDCKLIATYGRPHSYSSDLNVNLNPDDERAYWPDLNIQIEFDVKLYNQALATNTINELRLIVKSYFNRLTSVHTPVDAISMDNNIYISHVIQQMEAHDNVAWMKFKGWYTNEKGRVDGNYMDANTQAIVQKWKSFEDMLKDREGKSELERYTPEMFVMEDDNIVINIIK
jgi:hypothetical protein